MQLAELEAMSTEEIKARFEDIMQEIVIQHGDNIGAKELNQEKGVRRDEQSLPMGL